MVIFLNADGSCQKVTPEHVYQGSNNVNDITVIAPYAPQTAMQIGFILPNGLYWETPDGSRYAPMEFMEQSISNNVTAWHYNLTGSITERMGELYVAINAVTAKGNTTSYMCKVFIEESVLPNLPSAPEPSVYELLQLYLARLDDRTKNVPNLVASIQKVAGNAFTYTDNSGVESTPIVLTGGADVPIPVNAASTIKVPKEAFAAVEGGYSYTVTAEIHGQMRDGAAARDLWVSFDEAEEAAFKGAYEDYTVNEAGDITITVTTPVELTVRVWNGKGLVDEVARADIAAETERAEAEENRLQEQITELQNTGVDVVARADIAVLKEDLAAEVERAENAEGVLASDIQGLREDITNEAHFRGYLETNAEIEALSGTPNDYAYSAESGTVWIYQTETGWTDSGKTVPDQFTPASTSVPLMDGVGSAGVTEEYARGDHRHPSDTNKLDKSGGTMTGLLKLANDGLRSGNEEYGVQVDRYLNFHALNKANSWGVFNQQNEQVFQVAYQTKKVRVNGELEENGQRVYSPNNPPPAGGVNPATPTSLGTVYGETNANYSNTILGYNARAAGLNSVAVGRNSNAVANNSVAVGYAATCNGNAQGSIAIGLNAYSSAMGSIVIGRYTSVLSTSTQSIALGDSPIVNGSMSMGIGAYSRANAQCTVAIGHNSQALDTNAIAIGVFSSSYGLDSIAIGRGAQAGPNGTSIGHNTYANFNGVAIGMDARSRGLSGVAIGYKSACLGDQSIVIGSGAEGLFPNGVAIGYEAVLNNNFAVAVGYHAFASYSSAAFGMAAKASANFSTALGYAANVTVANTIVLGNTGVRSLRCAVQTITSLSDERTKEEITLANTAQCLADVERLPVKRFKFKKWAKPNPLDIHRTGFIAQDVEKVFPKDVQSDPDSFPVLDEDGNPVMEDELDENGNIVFEEDGITPKQREKTFTIEDCKKISMQDGLPTLWGAVQFLSQELKATKAELEKIKKYINYTEEIKA